MKIFNTYTVTLTHDDGRVEQVTVQATNSYQAKLKAMRKVAKMFEFTRINSVQKV